MSMERFLGACSCPQSGHRGQFSDEGPPAWVNMASTASPQRWAACARDDLIGGAATGCELT